MDRAGQAGAVGCQWVVKGCCYPRLLQPMGDRAALVHMHMSTGTDWVQHVQLSAEAHQQAAGPAEWGCV
jgi:hypothetical protein